MTFYPRKLPESRLSMLAMLQLLSGKVKDFKAIGFSEGTTGFGAARAVWIGQGRR